MIENGTCDLVLSRPISRTRTFLEMVLSAALAGLITSVVTLLAVWVSTFIVKNNGLDWTWVIIAQLIEMSFFCFAMGLACCSAPFWTPAGQQVAQPSASLAWDYLISIVGSLSPNLDWLQRIGPYYYAKGANALVEHTVTVWYPFVLLGAGLICALAGLIIFNRRDLPTT